MKTITTVCDRLLRGRRSHRQQPRGQLRRERIRRDALRRLAVACSAGMAVFCVLQAVSSIIPSQPVVVANVAVARGTSLHASMLTERIVPGNDTLRTAIRSPTDALGMVAQVDIAAGEPLLGSMIRAAPVAPAGHAVVDVRPVSNVDDIVVGDRVALTAVDGCVGDAGGMDIGNENGNANDDAKGGVAGGAASDALGDLTGGEARAGLAASCQLSGEALVMHVDYGNDGNESAADGNGIGSSRGDDLDGGAGRFGQMSSEGTGAMLTLAMPPSDAGRVFNGGNERGILVVGLGRVGQHRLEETP